MHQHTRAAFPFIAALLAASIVGCGGDAPLLDDGGRRDVGDAGCSVDNGGCSTSPMVVCSVGTDGNATCGSCPAGYSGDGRVCTSDVMVNECALGTHNCSPHATCTDTASAFSCACGAGYMGDGATCTRIGCTNASQCDDGVACTNDTCGISGNCIHTPVPALCPVGTSCNLTTGCLAGRICGSHADCVDTDPCTRNEACNPVSATCTFTILDNDMDGEPPLVCGGTDCDDSDDEVGARIPEICGNLIDDDCNGVPDTDATVDTDVSLRNDESNCGACGRQCNANQTCFQGNCVACGGAAGAACCDTYCTASDACTGGSCNVGMDCPITGGAAACASCGTVGQRCCGGTQCSQGTCASGTCVACGSIGQVCCSGVLCGAGAACSGGSCVACGGIGQPCCGGSACGGGATCGGGSCVACGGVSQPCCVGDACDSGTTCAFGVCASCGGAGQPCCAGQCPIDMGVWDRDMGVPPSDMGVSPSDIGIGPMLSPPQVRIVHAVSDFLRNGTSTPIPINGIRLCVETSFGVIAQPANADVNPEYDLRQGIPHRALTPYLNPLPMSTVRVYDEATIDNDAPGALPPAVNCPQPGFDSDCTDDAVPCLLQFDFDPAGLEDGKFYSIILHGFNDNTDTCGVGVACPAAAVRAEIEEDEYESDATSSGSRVRVFHGVHNLFPIDLCYDVDGLAGQVSGSIALHIGTNPGEASDYTTMPALAIGTGILFIALKNPADPDTLAGPCAFSATIGANGLPSNVLPVFFSAYNATSNNPSTNVVDGSIFTVFVTGDSRFFLPPPGTPTNDPVGWANYAGRTPIPLVFFDYSPI